jgi:hypothetical protein
VTSEITVSPVATITVSPVSSSASLSGIANVSHNYHVTTIERQN